MPVTGVSVDFSLSLKSLLKGEMELHNITVVMYLCLITW